MTIKHVYYPRGYRRWLLGSETQPTCAAGYLIDDGKAMVSEGDLDVMALFKDYRTAGVDIHGWAFMKRVVAIAKRLMPNLPEFLNAQVNNPYVHAANYQFLDTLARQHNRQPVHLTPMMAVELLEKNPRPHGRELRGRTTPQLIDTADGLSGRLPERFTAFWLDVTPVEDIVWTLYVLFGSEASE